MNKLDIKELQNRLDAISEGQLNEDLIDAGSPLEDILEMNLFMDMLNVNPEDCPAGSDEMANVNSDREFKGLDYLVTRDLCAKYKPIAMQLAKQIQAQADRELTEDEADMLNEVWYEASDLYQNGDDSELARIYDEQIQLIKQLLSSANESQVNEYYVKSAEDVLNTFPLFMYRKSNPSYDKTNEIDQDLAKDFGDQADEAYEMFQQWIAKGNKLSKNQIEMLDGDADKFFNIDMDDDDPIGDMIEALDDAASSIDLIVNGKVESVEEVHEEEAVEETVEVPVSALQELMKLAGYKQYKIDEYANEPEEEYSSAEDQMDLGGGLNGPKKAYAAAAGGDNPMDQEPTEIEEDNKLTFEGMYKRYMTQVVEETLEEKE